MRKGVLYNNIDVMQYGKADISHMTSRKHILVIKITLVLFLSSFVLYLFAFPNDGNLAYAVINSTSLPDFNFAAAGDWGCNPVSNQTVKNMVDKDPELVLGLGDFSYGEKADCWLRLVDPLDHKMKIVIGNHDHQVYITNTTTVASPSLLQQYMDHFNLTKQYYSFDYQNVHFIAISTEVQFEIGSDQYNFVQKDLEKAASDPNIDWIIAFYHRLAYSSPALLNSIAKIRDTYHPLFEKYDVDLVMQGHSHNYQRTFPIMYNGLNTAGPIITEYNKTSYINPSGQIFATVGTAGAPDIHRFSAPQNRFTAVEFNAFGFLNIDVLHNGTMLEGKFYENNGTIKDQFMITKSSNKE
jgi:predicted phosphodiesterase